MLVRYVKPAAGIGEGTVKFLPDRLAVEMIGMGVVEAVKAPSRAKVEDEPAEPVKAAEKTAKRARKQIAR